MRTRTSPGTARVPFKRTENPALTRFLAVCIWAPILPLAVDFDTLAAPAPVGGAALAMASLSPNPVARTLKIVLILIGTLVIATHVSEARALLRRLNIFFLVFLILALTSVTWSADPGSTIARYVSYSSTVVISVAFCLAGWHRKRLQNVVRPLLTMVMAGSLIYIIMFPEYAIDPDKAGYHGLAAQKNPFGELCAFGTLLWMHGWITGEVRGWRAVTGAALGWACLWLSKSSTSLLATGFATWLMVMLFHTTPAIRRYTPYIVTLFACLVIAYALAVLNLVPGLATILLGPITAITGKDMTFSNRAMIWEIIKEHAQLHPILGTGYGAYWTGAVPASPSYVFITRMYFWPSEAHNGYLDVVNDLGFVGLLCLLGYLTVFVSQSLQLFRADRPQGALYLALFFQQALNNLSESTWFSPMGTLPIVIVTLATCTLARGLQDQQQRPRGLQGGAANPSIALRNRAGFRR